ncbi:MULTISPECIES: hypothetical protein [Deefgea]|uniref:Lipid A palmitoyltransferase PagP n=1 Tax=Deefgea chitinilytica TaxID=570276 RepID=A0ABS2C7Q5_9NEIS|nr:MULTISPECIES: hypothetical protein [Deefgea]MBM5570184.1 hypothetical protein [Deefgea chitinilytica]MBM9887413.1 hypothetical protein [Deefgea sp. CFH1-16]
MKLKTIIPVAIVTLLCHIGLSHAQENELSSTQAFGELTPDFITRMNTHNDWRTWITSPVWTHHYNRDMVHDGDLSENNPGIGIERSNGLWHWMLGGYRNSIRQNSLYAQLAWTPLQLEFCQNGNLSLGATAGLLTGYKTKVNKYDVIPAGGLFISLETPYHFGVNLVVVPTIKSVDLEGFVAAQIKIHF